MKRRRKRINQKQNNSMKDELLKLSQGISSKAIASGYFIKAGIHSDRALKVFLKKVLMTVIPDRVICNNKYHRSPFSFISDIFLKRVEDALLHANRSGGKSYGAGLLTWLRGVFDGGSTRLLGGSWDQSEKSYEEFANCWEISGLKPQFVVGEVQKSETRLKNKAKIEILAASMTSVRGPHQPNLILDELEEMKRKVFEAALSQPQTEGKAKASTIYMSTMHKADGLMAELLDTYKERHLTLYQWCIFEILSSCVDFKCSTCPISGICPGKQMKNANGYYSIHDLQKKMYQLNQEDFEVEWLCEKPEKKHLVYSKFNEDRVVDCPYNPGLSVELALDFGGVHPFVVLVIQRVPALGDVIVDEIYIGAVDNPYVIELARARDWWKAAQRRPAYCDPTRQDLIREWRKAGINAQSVRSLIDDISLVRTKIAPMKGKPSLHVHKGCEHTIWEFNHYRSKDDNTPEDKNNHAMEAVRRYVRATKGMTDERPGVKLGRSKSLLGVSLDKWPLFKKEI